MKRFEDERDYAVPKMTMRSGKGAHVPKLHREKFKKFIKEADLEEDDFEDWEE
jgi:hypothetical protein